MHFFRCFKSHWFPAQEQQICKNCLIIIETKYVSVCFIWSGSLLLRHGYNCEARGLWDQALDVRGEIQIQESHYITFIISANCWCYLLQLKFSEHVIQRDLGTVDAAVYTKVCIQVFKEDTNHWSLPVTTS